MNKNIFIYLLFVLVILSAAFGAVSASENITEPVLSSADEGYIAQDEALSLSYEESIENDQDTLSLSEENETLSLSEESADDELLELGERVDTTNKGPDYVQMTDGKTAFCVNRNGGIPTANTPYYTVHINTLYHDLRTNERVDNKLRLVAVHYADLPEFKEEITMWRVGAGKFSYTQLLIWYITRFDDSKYYMGDLDGVPRLKDAYWDIINRHNNGEWIPEDSVTYRRDNQEIRYEFSAYSPYTSGYQKLFGYKKIVTDIPEPVKNPAMEVTKKSLTPSVKVGEQTKFLITVKNTGELDLNNVFVEEQIPDGLTFADYNDKSLWRKDGNTFYYNNVLAVGETASFTIDFNTHINGTFVNCVVAGSDETDKKTSNNTTTVKKPDMIVDKESLTPNVKVGEQTLFLITVKNTGQLDLGNVFVEEEMPEGLTFADYNDKSLWRKEGNIFYYNNVLKVGQSASFTIAFNTSREGKFINCVVAGSNETDKKTSNNTTTVLKPDFEVQKITITPVVMLGNQATFEIVVKNTGETTLTNVFVEESSYDGLTYSTYTDNGIWTHSIVNGKNRWTLNSDLAVNEVVGLFVVFDTTKTGSFTNVVVAGSDDTENKTTDNTTKVVEPKLDVQKISLNPVVHVGNQTSFEILVKNTGEVALHNVVLEETSYEGLTYDSYVIDNEWTHSVANGKNIWTLNKVLNVNEVVTLIVNFKTTQVGNFTNIVTAGSNETKNKVANNTTTVYNTTTPEPESNSTKDPNINIVKTSLQDVVIIGSQATFEIIVTNTGNTVLNDVTVSEDSFNGLTYDSWYDNTGLWSKNRDLTWTMNSPLYLGETATFYVVFNTTRTGEFRNVVSVTSDQTDKKSANDTVEVIKPDFAVEKIALNKTAVVGDTVTFEIVVHNLGQTTLNNVVVKESSFEGLVYDSFADPANLWTKNRDLSWSLNAPLYVGEYAGFFVTFKTTATGEFTNVVVADSTEIPNKTANDTVEVLQPNLEVQKITINKTVYVGEKVMFEIVVRNAGKVILNDVTVRENSFDGLVYDSFIDNNNLWTKNSDLSWTLNVPLYAGEYLSLFVVFDTNKAGTFTNIVSASSDKTPVKNANNVTTVIERPTTPEEDIPVPEENETTPEENETYTPMADLAIVKMAYAVDGDVVTWGLYVVNNGPDKAVNARVLDALPLTLQYINSIPSKGSYDANTGVWTIGDMENGEEAVMILVTRILAEGEITNEAIVTSDTFDPNLNNNYDNDTVISVDIPEVPQDDNPGTPQPVDVTPATGNPLVMVLLALFALATGTLRRRK